MTGLPLYSDPLLSDCPYADQLYSDSANQVSPRYTNMEFSTTGHMKNNNITLPTSFSPSPSRPCRRRTRLRVSSGDSECARSTSSSEDALSTPLSRLSLSSESDGRQSSSDLSEATAESFSSGYGSNISQSSPTLPSHWESLSESPSKSPLSYLCEEVNEKGDSRSKSPSSSPTRKDSFVYDVRMTDDKFLFFVPDLDLVKSHLMFAVREEVDVLKDRIVELMERVKQLECENSVLRQYASSEAIQQLQQTPPSSNSHHSSS